jgi:TolA-binding protein
MMKKLLLLAFFFVSSANAEGINPAVIADISARMTALEEQNRQLTGRIEELEYYSKQLEAKLAAAPAPTPAIAEPAPVASDNPYVTIVGDENPIDVTRPEPAAQPNSNIEDDFDVAFSHIATEDYAKAVPALTEFIKKHPKTDLAGEAYFWLGEVAWSKKDYTNNYHGKLKTTFNGFFHNIVSI